MLVRPLIDPPVALTGAQKVACAVIRQALADLCLGAGSETAWRQRRATAAAWLTPDSAGLRWWCRVAGLEPTTVLRRVDAAAQLGLARRGRRPSFRSHA